MGFYRWLCSQVVVVSADVSFIADLRYLDMVLDRMRQAQNEWLAGGALCRYSPRFLSREDNYEAATVAKLFGERDRFDSFGDVGPRAASESVDGL